MFLAEEGYAEKVGLRPIAILETPTTTSIHKGAPANQIAYLLLSPNFSVRSRPRLIDEHFPVASMGEKARQ